MGCVFLFNQHTELSCTLNFSYKTTWIKISMEGIVFYQVSNSCMDFTQLPGNLPRPLMICLHESDPNENSQRHLFQRNKRDERFESEGPCPPSTPGGPCLAAGSHGCPVTPWAFLPAATACCCCSPWPSPLCHNETDMPVVTFRQVFDSSDLDNYCLSLPLEEEAIWPPNVWLEFH